MTNTDIMQLASDEADKIKRIFPETDKKALELAFHAGRVSVVEEMSAVFRVKDAIQKASASN